MTTADADDKPADDKAADDKAADDQPDGAIASRSAFRDTIALLLAEAADAGSRELLIVDPDFTEWPLGDRAVVETLTRWAMPHRRLTVLAARYDALARAHPRWVAWRRTYAHVIECREADEADARDLPTLLIAQGRCGLRMADMHLVRGRMTRHTGDLLRWSDEVDAVLQRSSPSFAATTLGL